VAIQYCRILLDDQTECVKRYHAPADDVLAQIARVTSLAVYGIRRGVGPSTDTRICSTSSTRRARRDCSFCSFRRARMVLLYSFIRRAKKAETIF